LFVIYKKESEILKLKV